MLHDEHPREARGIVRLGSAARAPAERGDAARLGSAARAPAERGGAARLGSAARAPAERGGAARLCAAGSQCSLPIYIFHYFFLTSNPEVKDTSFPLPLSRFAPPPVVSMERVVLR